MIVWPIVCNDSRQASHGFREAYLRVVEHWKGPRHEIAMNYKAKLAKLTSLIPLDWNLVRVARRSGRVYQPSRWNSV